MKSIKNSITLEGVTYGVSKIYPLFDVAWGDATYEIIETTCTRERELFTWIPLLCKGKFRFLKKTLVRERLILYRFIDIEDYPSFNWGKWEEKWEIEEIII